MLEMRSHHRALSRDLMDLEKRLAMEARQTEATMATRNALLGAQGGWQLGKSRLAWIKAAEKHIFAPMVREYLYNSYRCTKR